MEQVIILDIPRGGLSDLAKNIERAGVSVFRQVDGEGPADVSSQDLLGVVVHHKRAPEIKDVCMAPALAHAPVLVWYPVRTGARELESWSATPALDLLVGKVDVQELLARLRGYNRSMRAKLPWMHQAVQALNRVSRTVTSREDDFTVLSTTAKELEKLFPGIYCTVLMLSAETDSAMVITQGARTRPLNIQLDINKYPEIQKMLATMKPVYIKNVQKHSLMREVRDLLKSKDLYSILVVPIFYRDQVIGLIMLRSTGSPRSFDRVEINFCNMVAQSTAVALRNIRLGREMAQEVKRSKEAIKIARQKSSDLARMEAMFDHASDGIMVVDDQGNVKGVNVNFTRLSGYAKNDVEKKNIDQFLYPGPGEAFSVMRVLRDEEVRKDPEALRSIHVLHRKDGSRLQVATRLDHLPHRREWLVSMHDVTEERELEEALKRTKDFLENMIQSSMDAIIAADMSGTIILFNRAAEEISGYEASDVIGKMNIVDFYAPGVARAVMKKLRSEDYGGRGKLESSYNALVGSDGEEIPINMSAAIIYEHGREVASVGIFQDLRERIQIEKELREAQEKLMESQQRDALTALSGAASHQLNQPLTSIMGYAELLKRAEQKLKAEFPDHPALKSLGNAVEVIGQESERMAEVVRKIGEVSQYETTDYVGGARIMDLDRASEVPSKEEVALWKAMFEHMKEAVIVGGEDTVIRMANPASVELTGEDPVGKSFTRYLEGIEHRKAMEAFEAVKNGEHRDLELEVTAVGGKKKTVKVSAVPAADRGIMAIYSDVTEIKKSEQMLRDLSAFQDQLMNNTTLPLVGMDLDGKITFWNRAAQRMFGYSAQEASGKTPEFLIKGMEPSELRDHIRRLRKEGDLAEEARMTNSSGEEFKVFRVDTLVRDEQGQAVGILSMLFDLSERQAYEKELKQKTQQLALINDIVDSIRTGLGLETGLGGVLRLLSRALPFDLGALTIGEPGADQIMVIGYIPEQNRIYKETIRLYDDADEVKKFIFSKETSIYKDASTIRPELVPDSVKAHVRKLGQEGFKSLINYPLTYRDEVLGALHITSKRPDAFTDSDLANIAPMAGPITMGLVNARLFSQIQQHNIELASRSSWMEETISSGQHIDPGMQPEQVLSTLLDPYLKAHQRQHLTAWLKDPETGELSLAAAHRYQEQELKRELELNHEFVKTIQGDQEVKELRLTGEGDTYRPLLQDAKSALIVPLAAMDTWLGAIILESHHKNAFTDQEQLDVRIMASHIAGTLRNLNFLRDLDLSLRFQRGIIDNANALVVILDPNGRISLVNKALQELVGVSADRLTGRDYRDIFERHLRVEMPDGERVALGQENFKKLVRKVLKGKNLENIRVTMTTPEGRETRAIFNTSTILDMEGRFQGFIAIGQNITRYQELEKNLLQAEKLATVGQMAAGIAHDLNNPITGVLSYAEMLQQNEGLDQHARAQLQRLQEEAERIQALSRNLMSYARPSEESSFPLDLRELVLNSLSFSHYELSREQVKVETDIPESLPRIRGIKDQLQQALINLLGNASQACAEKGGGKVVISACEGQDHSVEIKVMDTGQGIPRDNMDRLFDPFFTTKPEGKGTGLGLLIVKEIIERHHGSVDVQSEPGKGTTFTITLPVYSKQEA